MDLIGFRCKHFRLIWILLGTSLLCSVAYSWRISQKCPHGHYYNDGCTACWCDIRTGITKCEKLLQCARRNGNANCPRGRHYKDNCGNDCTCYESTGAVFCNEKRRCPPPTMPPPPVPVSSVNSNVFQRRDGLLAVNDEPMIMQSSTPRSFIHEYTSVPNSTPRSFMNEYHSFPSSTPRSFMNEYPSVPSSTPGSFMNGFPSIPSNTRSSIYDNVAISSTPYSHLKGPGRSEELIIEPAIIIRKKGSNKASVVRNPYSATSVTLSGSSRNQNPSVFTPTRGTSTIYLNDNKPQNPKPPVAPLHLYQKQLKTIMDIRKAYAQLFRSKVNVNLRLAPSAPSSSNNNLDLNKFFIPQGNSYPTGSTEHPRRFDSEYGNSTVFTNTSPSPNFFSPSQQPAPPIQSTPLWRKPELIRNEIRNVLKNFSPVPPLKKLVNFVTTSTESYLSQFLNAGIRNRLNQQQPQQNTNFPIFGTTTNTPISSPMSISNGANVFTNGNSNSWPYSYSSSSPEPYHEVNQFAPQYNMNTPIHQVYQNHDFTQIYTTTTTATTTPPPPTVQYTSYSDNYEQQQNHNLHYSSYYPKQFEKTKKPSNPYSPNHPQFPFMTELMHEIARVDSYDQSQSPTVSTPRSSSALTAIPTFSTPGPPYAEVDVVQPLSFLPPPRPEPATPTHRSFTVRPPPSRLRYPPPRPTVRINMDKPIYVPNLMFPPQPMSPIRRNFVKPPFYQIHRQYIIPKPKQYRLVLKGGLREAAIRVDDVVPRFVSRIAQEFFKKPEIYVPKIRPGKPLTLEKVVLNHKELIPKEVVFHKGESPTKMRFTPNAQWTMREEMAKHGIMLNEPLSPTRDYGNNDPNVMEMDAPIHAVQTHETHTNMGMGHYPEAAPALFNVGPPTSINDQLNQIRQQQDQHKSSFSTHNIQQNQHLSSFSNQNIQLNQRQTSFSNQNIQLNQHQRNQQKPAFSSQNIHLSQYLFNQQQSQQQQQPQFSIFLPSPTPPQHQLRPPAITMDHQHQQDLQSQLNLLAQQHSINTAAAASAGSTSNNAFQYDPNEFNDFKREDEQDVLPKELQIPGVQQVIVDKVIVHDPLQPGGPIVFSTTTVQPPRNGNSQLLMNTIRRDGNTGGQMQPNLNFGPTPASVLIRHHGAPSPSPASPTETPSTGGNFLVTIINSTPNPHVTSTATTAVFQPPPQTPETNNADVSNLASQIHEFLANQMDFGAKQEDSGLYGMMFQSRSGIPAEDPENDQPEPETRAEENEYRNDPDLFEDQIATETKMSTEVVDTKVEVDTDRLANIFSQDYQRTHGKKAPEVIVIRVPLNHSDGPFPKVIEKRGGEEVEIIGGSLPTHNKKSNETLSEEDEDDEEISPSTENSIITSTSKSVSSSESKSESREEDGDNKSSKSKRRRKKNKKRKRRKKNRRHRNRNVDEVDDSNKEEIPKTEDKKEETKSEKGDNEKTISSITSEAESKFQAEIDWKSQLMSNICELNPSSPLCLTYRSICLLMTSDD
ncbi:unnamed protein product [Orchesella dallaii]|uniref:Uncharacterized protein n=1 Tax=Orchesella dallaii TaxID=48710 RepID=A0ABP1R756_9HEXA